MYKKEEKLIKGLSGAVLHIGCGTGRALEVLAMRCDKVVGIDKEKIMVEASNKNTKNLNNVSVYLQNAKKMEFSDNVFDAVVCLASTFGNFGKDKTSILAEMKRVCKKDGQIIISVYNERALKPRLKSYKKDELTHVKITKTGTVYSKEGLFSEQFTKSKIKGIFNKVGLQCKITELNPISYLCVCRK